MGQLTLAAVAVAVASLLANAWLVQAHLSLRDQLVAAKALVASAEQQRDTAQATTLECGNAVDALDTLSKDRAKEATTARNQAAAQARAAAQRADRILAAPAAVPGDDCASAQVRVQSWLQTRSSYAP